EERSRAHDGPGHRLRHRVAGLVAVGGVPAVGGGPLGCAVRHFWDSPLTRHEVDQRADREDEQHHEHERDDRELGRVHLGTLVGRLAADAERAGEHHLDRLHHDLPPRPATSKKVYDSAMVFTPAGSLGSITKVTGMRRVSPAASVCCLKQKHSSLLKYSAAY